MSSDSENSEDSSVTIVENLNSEEHFVISSDSRVEQIKTECCTTKYHNDNKETPIYSTPTEALAAVEIFKLAFGEKEEKYACTENLLALGITLCLSLILIKLICDRFMQMTTVF